MIAVLYIGVNFCINQFVFQILCNAYVVYSPAFILQSHTRKSLAPPTIFMSCFGVAMPKRIYKTTKNTKYFKICFLFWIFNICFL